MSKIVDIIFNSMHSLIHYLIFAFPYFSSRGHTMPSSQTQVNTQPLKFTLTCLPVIKDGPCRWLLRIIYSSNFTSLKTSKGGGHEGRQGSLVWPHAQQGHLHGQYWRGSSSRIQFLFQRTGSNVVSMNGTCVIRLNLLLLFDLTPCYLCQF